MLFNSIDFLIFFPIVVLAYLIMPKRLKKYWLLIASYYFYMCWNAQYAVLIMLSTFITYIAGIGIEKITNIILKRCVLTLGLVSNLLILFFFKYFDFFIDNLNRVFAVLNVQTVNNPYSLLLPVGISFYTFQALGYVIDVYRGTIPAEKNIIKYALFVSFFPQLVAGPIERSESLLGQINKMEKERIVSLDNLVYGFCLIVWGLFQKMVIADRVSIFVDSVYDNLYACGTVETVICAVFFAIQIYCDFAGYTSIAIGAAKVMGFELMENFDTPYLASSISDFWRRWHISLSSWFRDYLYIPLGGNRCSKIKKYRNILITFLVSGLWHGAAWNYVCWGGIHGFYQIVGDITRGVKDKACDILSIKRDVFSYKFGQMCVTFILTCFAWIFFRAQNIDQVFYYLNRMFTRFNPWMLINGSLYEFGLNSIEMRVAVISIVILLIVDLIKYTKKQNIAAFLMEQNVLFRWLVLWVLILGIFVFGEYGIAFDSSQFIYFAF